MRMLSHIRVPNHKIVDIFQWQFNLSLAPTITELSEYLPIARGILANRVFGIYKLTLRKYFSH